MLQLIIDYGTAISFIALTVDVMLQIGRVMRRRSSHDVSYNGLFIRVLGCVVLMVKFVSLGDVFLIAGQALITAAVVAYLWVVVTHQRS